jgi:hypothetical protein
LKQVFKEIHLFEKRQHSKKAINLALGVGSSFQQLQSLPNQAIPSNQSTSLPVEEKKKFVKEECLNGFHNPKATHKEENCFSVDPKQALAYFQKKQAKKVTTEESNFDNLKTFAIQGTKLSDKIILDSGASASMLKNQEFFDIVVRSL